MSTRFRGGGAWLNALRAPIIIALLIAASIAVRQANGQGRSDLTVSVPSVFQVETATETPLQIQITPESAVPKQAMVLIRGLPSSFALSEGRLFHSGIWALRVGDLPGLRVAAPSTPGEKTQLSIALVTLDGAVLAEAKSTLEVTAPQANAPAAVASPPVTTATIPKAQDRDPAPQPSKATLSPEEQQRVEMFMKKGEENMKGGQVNVARLFYKRAAEMGWAPAAMALAGTYDPAELERSGVVGGIQPDPKLAKHWYEAARDLGSQEAQQRLSGR